MILFAVLTILNIKDQLSKIQIKNQKFYILLYHFAFCILIFILILPGIAYLSIYQNPDVRFQASEWIYKNIPEGAYILSETANVVDIPIQIPHFAKASRGKQNSSLKSYNIVSFDFYNLDENPILQQELQNHLAKADYIFVPSRRIFANHTCIENFQSNLRCKKLKEMYPLLNQYYNYLF